MEPLPCLLLALAAFVAGYLLGLANGHSARRRR
jgi:hypothetical protein